MLIYPLFSIFNIWMRPVVDCYRYMFIARLSGLVWHKILWRISSPHLLLVDLSTSQYTHCTHGIRQYLSKSTNAFSHNTVQLCILKRCFFVTVSFSIRLYIFCFEWCSFYPELQSCGSGFIESGSGYGSGSSISRESGSNPDLGFWWPKTEEKKTDEEFFDQKLQFTYVQATGENFSPEKRTSSTLKNVIY